MEYLKRYNIIYIIAENKFLDEFKKLFKLLKINLDTKINFLKRIKAIFKRNFYFIDLENRDFDFSKNSLRILFCINSNDKNMSSINRIIKKLKRSDIAFINSNKLKKIKNIKCEVFTYGYSKKADLEIVEFIKNRQKNILKLRYKGAIAPFHFKYERNYTLYLNLILFLLKVFDKNLLESISLVENLVNNSVLTLEDLSS